MEFNHFDEHGNARMVDVSQKDTTKRKAIATGKIFLCDEAFNKIQNKEVKKGDVLTVAQVAGILGAKKTSDLIPMTHPIIINGIDLTFSLNDKEKSIKAKASIMTEGKTGVEIEAITAVSISLLTIYDMVKAIDKSMVISNIQLEYKTGGKNGEYKRK